MSSGFESERKRTHEIRLLGRAEMSVSGVEEVVSFDDSAVVLHTQLGTLSIHGKELKLKTLSLEGGQVAVDGHITALIYEEPRPAGGWMRRLLG